MLVAGVVTAHSVRRGHVGRYPRVTMTIAPTFLCRVMNELCLRVPIIDRPRRVGRLFAAPLLLRSDWFCVAETSETRR